jgi:hypothetical protein
MLSAGWPDHPLRTARRVRKGLPKGHLTHGTNMFTLLAGPPGGFRGVPAEEWAGEIGRRQRLAGIHDPGGERHHLLGVGEGPAEVAAEAKQVRRVLAMRWISEGDRRRVVEARRGGGEFLLLSWVNPSRSICNTICNSRAPLGYGWASVSLRPAYYTCTFPS